MTKTALITGITGQDGAYLAQLLLQKGYRVVGAKRRSANQNLWRLEELGIANSIEMVEFDLLEYSNIQHAINSVKPDELYNLGAQSFVGTSFVQPILTADIDGMGVVRILEACRLLNPGVRFYQASTSEMFGKVQSIPQLEATPFYPRSPYGVAKLYGHWITVNYRESYNMHACSGILFNHESPLRGEEFVTRKVTVALAKIMAGKQDVLTLGNLDAKRDWGFAGDYVEGMWRMTVADKADDYVLATGETHSIRTFIELACKHIGITIAWEGEGESSIGRNTQTGKVLVNVSKAFYRPAEVDLLIGDPTRAKKELGWNPKVNFEGLVTMMMDADMKRFA
jgi:GDPmannose 4,6-dehydratase